MRKRRMRMRWLMMMRRRIKRRMEGLHHKVSIESQQ
jgi:hypothetical protein